MPINKQKFKSDKAGLEQPAFVKVESLTLYNGEVVLPCGEGEERVDVIFTRSSKDNAIDNAIAVTPDGEFFCSAKDRRFDQMVEFITASFKLMILLAFMPDLPPAVTKMYMTNMKTNFQLQRWEYGSGKVI